VPAALPSLPEMTSRPHAEHITATSCLSNDLWGRRTKQPAHSCGTKSTRVAKPSGFSSNQPPGSQLGLSRYPSRLNLESESSDSGSHG